MLAHPLWYPCVPVLAAVMILPTLVIPKLALAAPGEFGEAEVVVQWSRLGDPDSYYGWAIADVVDTNGDGATELAVGAPQTSGAEGTTGQLDLLSGRDGEVLWSVIGEPGDLLGYALADAGDVDGDGTHDVIVGAPGAEGGGRVDVLSGVDGLVLLSIPSPDSTAFFGAAVASGGQLDDDELPDLIVGGPATISEGGQPGDNAGAIWALSGADGAMLWQLRGQPGDRLGSGTAYVGDLDGDGFDDPFVGARDGGGGRGWAAVLSGIDGAALLEFTPDELGGDFGWFFVAGLGDLDGDAVVELYVGDFAASVGGAATGRVHVYSGASGAELLSIAGEGAGEGLGPGRGAGDVDGDGVLDVISGAYSSSVGAAQSGRAFVFSGADGHVLRTITSVNVGEQFGFDAIGLGDVDGDGAIDLAVSAAEGDAVYLIAGLGGEGGETEGGETSGGDTSGGDTSGGDDDESTTTASGSDEGGSGCGCSLDADDQPAMLGLALLGLLGLRRRRQSSAACSSAF